MLFLHGPSLHKCAPIGQTQGSNRTWYGWFAPRCHLSCQIQARRSAPCSSAAFRFFQTNLMALLAHRNTRIHVQELLIFYACKSAGDFRLVAYKVAPMFLPCSDQTQSLRRSCSRARGSFFRGPKLRSHFLAIDLRKASPSDFCWESRCFCWLKFISGLKADLEVDLRAFYRCSSSLVVLAG